MRNHLQQLIKLIEFIGSSGDWILIAVHFFKQMGLFAVITNKNSTDAIYDDTSDAAEHNNGSLIFFMTTASIGSYAIYFSVGGVLHVSMQSGRPVMPNGWFSNNDFSGISMWNNVMILTIGNANRRNSYHLNWNCTKSYLDRFHCFGVAF